jgi:ABC-type multidrug transport system fused ATPase/permease subunit
MTDVIGFFSVSFRMYAELQNFMTSSQRLHQYTTLELEDKLEKEIDKNLKLINWPDKGQITFDNVRMRYRKELPQYAIDGLDCEIQGGMKVGIVGRTGAGKSSIQQTLFRLVELDKKDGGCIKIDNQDLADVGLH